MKKKSTESAKSSFKTYSKQALFGIFAFAVGGATGVGISQKPTEQKHQTVGQESIRGDLPTTSYVIMRTGYSLAYDPRTKNPVYVYEKLSQNSLVGRVSRDNFQFKEDTRIPDIFRSTLKDYKSSGYDRGHLAPAANHKGSSEAMEDTFFMSNMCPQAPQFNRGYWAQLEKHVRDLTREYKTVEVFTGPLYLPQEDKQGNRMVSYMVIGENDVAVPTHFYKVLLLENASGGVETRAYILPNATINSDTPLDKFATNVQQVQKVSGVLFKGKN